MDVERENKVRIRRSYTCMSLNEDHPVPLHTVSRVECEGGSFVGAEFVNEIK